MLFSIDTPSSTHRTYEIHFHSCSAGKTVLGTQTWTIMQMMFEAAFASALTLCVSKFIQSSCGVLLHAEPCAKSRKRKRQEEETFTFCTLGGKRRRRRGEKSSGNLAARREEHKERISLRSCDAKHTANPVWQRIGSKVRLPRTLAPIR